MLPSTTAHARAKVNLFLEIVGPRPDGYHDLVSVFQEVDLADELSALPAAPGVMALACDDPGMPTDGRNLVLAAANALRDEAGISEGIRFELKKRIPAGAGLGGGSSDAAAALRLANQLWGLGLSTAELAEIGSRVGSDVPFFCHGGTCLCEGRGEQVTPLPPAAGIRLLLAVPQWRIATATAYRALQGRVWKRRGPEAFLRAVEERDLAAMARESFNRFEGLVLDLEPRQRRLHAEAAAWPVHCARLTGSGSALWCLPIEGREAVPRTDGVELLGVRTVGGC